MLGESAPLDGFVGFAILSRDRVDFADFYIPRVRVDEWRCFWQFHFATSGSARDSEVACIRSETRQGRTEPFQSRLGGIDGLYRYITSRDGFGAERHDETVEASGSEQEIVGFVEEGVCINVSCLSGLLRDRYEIRQGLTDICLEALLLLHSRLKDLSRERWKKAPG